MQSLSPTSWEPRGSFRRSVNESLILLVSLCFEPRNFFRFVGEAVEAIREDQQGRCPEPYEYTKPLGMSLFDGIFTSQIPPDKD